MINLFAILDFIKKHYKLIFVGLFVFSLFCVVFLWHENSTLKDENGRLSNNNTALMTDIETYKTESGKNAAKLLQLEMTAGEFKQLCDDQLKVINDLNIKVKRLESISTTVTNTNVTGKTQLKDTVFITQIDSIIIKDSVKVFKWNDNWNHISGVIKGNDVECSYSGMDTLTIVANRVPKKFLFFRWGTKYIEVNLTNANPSSQVIYNRTIKIKK